MPYRTAPYWLLLTIVVIAVGFWPSYFSVVGTVPWQFHAHGVAATLWVAMVLAQTLLVKKERLHLHRAIGKASLFLFPFLIGGLFGIIDYTGKHFVSGEPDPVRAMLGGAFATGMAVAAAAYVAVFYQALKNRRKVWLHSGYMLTTPLILFESPFSRVLGMYVPMFMVTGPDTFDRILPSILWSMALELVFIAAVWWVHRDRARPFLVAGGFIVAQMVVMALSPRWHGLDQILVLVGQTPSAVVVMTGMAIGAAASWLGWQAGKAPQAAVRKVAA
jgi:hypothetical protein